MPKLLQIDSIKKDDDGLFIEGTIQNKQLSFLIDTGASVTIVKTSVYQEIPRDKRPPLEKVNVEMVAADGRSILCHGKGLFNLKIEGVELQHEVWVADISLDGILGFDFLNSNQCYLDVGKGELGFGELPNNPYDDDDDEESTVHVAASRTLEVPPESEAMITGRFLNKPSSPTEGILEPVYDFLSTHPLLLARTLVDTKNEDVVLRVLNVTQETICVHEGTIVANFDPICEISTKEEPKKCKSVHVAANQNDVNLSQLPEHLVEMWDRSISDLNEDQQSRFRQLLMKHYDLFAKSKDDLGVTDLVEHRINTGDAQPVRQRARRLPIQQREVEKEQIEDMLKRGIVTESQSPWASPVVLVRKKDNTWRWCVDFRAVNLLSIKDSYPLPRIDDSLDRLSGAKWFSTLDLQSGYWQVKMAPEDQAKTAFITSQGLYEFKVMPFGLANAPATFERLMERILKGLQWETCLVYLDDVVVFAQEFDQAIDRLDTVFSRLEAAGLKLNPNKCNLFQKEVAYLGHVVSENGIATDPEKISAVESWPIPRCVTELRSFLGTCSYYRKFILGYANIARPLHILTEKNRVFIWTAEAQEAFDKLKVALTSSPILAYPNPAGRFILDTDASNHGIAAVLSQEQNGVERVISYYSRTLNKPERRYCVTRKELLAIVASVRNYHHYLYGKEFLIRTDHGALRWLMNFKNPEGQVARWLEVLGTYEFRIEHRPGRYHGNCDGLSRRPCDGDKCDQCDRIERNMGDRPVHVPARLPKPDLVLDDKEKHPKLRNVEIDTASSSWVEGMDSAELRKAQLEDPVIKDVIAFKENRTERPTWTEVSPLGCTMKRYWSSWDLLFMQDGVLYRRWEEKVGGRHRNLVVLPEKLRNGALQGLHDDKVAGHLGQEKTYHRIRERFYWVGFKDDVDNWCKRCQGCVQKDKPKAANRAPMKIYNMGAPMERIALDILGPLPTSDQGNKYILCIGDYFTKWVSAVALPDQEAKTVARALIDNVITVFGLPRIIHSDQGRNFESILFHELCKLFDIEKTRTTPYRPQSDGFIERFNRTVLSMLGRYTSRDQKDWDRKLPFVLMAYRSAVHSSVGFSPNEMMLGHSVRLPIDLVYGTPPGEKYSRDEYVRELQNHLEEVHEYARKNLEISSSKQKKQYDHRCREIGFKELDLVWYYCPRRRKGLSPKLQNFWRGPCTVVNRLSDILYRIRLDDSNTTVVVHCDKLKLFSGNEEKPKSNGDAQTETKIDTSFYQTKTGRQCKPPQWYGISY